MRCSLAKTSPKKIASNRRNAKRSTGPKSQRGKQVVKRNALKHGLLSQDVVIQTGDGKEDPAEFNALTTQLGAQFQPEGILEEMLVERIAVCYWRLRRALKCEIGEIRKQLDSAVWRWVFKAADQFRETKEFGALGVGREKLEQSTMGVKHLRVVLENVKTGIEVEGRLTQHDTKHLAAAFGFDDSSLTHSLMVLDQMITSQSPGNKSESDEDWELPDPDHLKGAMMRFVDMELDRLKGMEQELTKMEEMDIEAQMLADQLPPKQVVEKILRYETTIERQLYRAIDQLERLQRSRRGEAVPPPINVQLNSSD